MLRAGFALVLPIASALLSGCSGVPAAHVPAINSTSAAADAIRQFDTNQDAHLSGDELNQTPGLKAALTTIDKDKDQRLSESEIAERLEVIGGADVAFVQFDCFVFFNERPLVGADVRMVPEPFMGPEIKPAKGTTDARGNAFCRAEEEGSPGVHRGIYRVEVSKKDASGKETIPAKYNSQTVLGQEVLFGLPDRERRVEYHLKSE